VLAVLAFGLYLFLWLLLGVASFKTVPEEAESLQLDIQRARLELSQRGIVI
jgi:Dolichol-phosphate mannosyltransferase subunit 3 (DPM3)